MRLVSGFLMGLIVANYKIPGTKQLIICMVLCCACGKGVHIMGCGGEKESFWLWVRNSEITRKREVTCEPETVQAHLKNRNTKK